MAASNIAQVKLGTPPPIPPEFQPKPEPPQPCARCGQAPGLTFSRYYEGRICTDCREIGLLEAAHEWELELRARKPAPSTA